MGGATPGDLAGKHARVVMATPKDVLIFGRKCEMSTNKNRHYVSTVEDRELAENKFRVKYSLDPISMRWIHDYPTPGGLQMAQDFLFEHSPWRGVK